MRNSWKLGLFGALGASLVFAGCSSGGDNSDNSGGSPGSGGSSAGKAGSGGLIVAGTTTTTTGGSSAGTTTGGNATGGNTSAGSAGKVGTGGSAGTAAGGSGGSGGASGGSGGTSTAGSGGAAGNGGTAGSGGAVACDDGDGFGLGGSSGSGGSGGAGSVVTAIVLVDNIVVKDGAAAAYKSWLFTDATDVLDDKVGDVGDKWVRLPFDAGSIGNNAGAHDVFSKCGGNPAGGLKNVVPFTAAGQYYETGIGFTGHDWSNYTVAADVKLVSGGNSQVGCPAHAELFINGSSGPTVGPSKLLKTGEWVALALTAPAATMTDHLGVRITSYMCQ